MDKVRQLAVNRLHHGVALLISMYTMRSNVELIHSGR